MRLYYEAALCRDREHLVILECKAVRYIIKYQVLFSKTQPNISENAVFKF